MSPDFDLGFDLDACRRRLAAWDVLQLPDEGRKRAAVALTITEAGHGVGLDGWPRHARWRREPALLLTLRAAGMRAHAGQWALPGGRLDVGESAQDAALRELAEEVGLQPGPAAVLGRLDDYATRSGYLITPLVVAVGAARRARANPAEVAGVHRVPCSELLRADAPLLNHVRRRDRVVLRMPLGRHWIAAPTAAFLYQFREVCLLDRATRVAHFDQPFFAWR